MKTIEEIREEAISVLMINRYDLNDTVNAILSIVIGKEEKTYYDAENSIGRFSVRYITIRDAIERVK